MLTRPDYIKMPADVMKASLAGDRSFGLGARNIHQRPKDWQLRSFAPEQMFPSRTHAAWLGSQMIRWGHIPADTDMPAIAQQCTDSTWFRSAAESLSVECPISDAPPMPLRNGVFELKEIPTGLPALAGS